MAKRASIKVSEFMRYESHLIKQIDKDSAKRQKFVIRTTETLKFTTCSIITRKRGHKRRKRLMN